VFQYSKKRSCTNRKAGGRKQLVARQRRIPCNTRHDAVWLAEKSERAEPAPTPCLSPGGATNLRRRSCAQRGMGWHSGARTSLRDLRLEFFEMRYRFLVVGPTLQIESDHIVGSQGALHKKGRVWEASPTPMLLRFGIRLVADSEIAVRDRSHRVFVQSGSQGRLATGPQRQQQAGDDCHVSLDLDSSLRRAEQMAAIRGTTSEGGPAAPPLRSPVFGGTCTRPARVDADDRAGRQTDFPRRARRAGRRGPRPRGPPATRSYSTLLAVQPMGSTSDVGSDFTGSRPCRAAS
jgi:hypothetical protein